MTIKSLKFSEILDPILALPSLGATGHLQKKSQVW